MNKALQNTNASSRSLSKELTDVNKLLKLDPKNTELLAQKQTVLKEAIGHTEDKLNTLKQAQKEMTAAGKDINDDAYRELQREIEKTSQQLSKYNREQKETKKQVDEVSRAFTKTKHEIVETVKESGTISKIKTAVKNVRQEIDSFKSQHPVIKKLLMDLELSRTVQ